MKMDYVEFVKKNKNSNNITYPDGMYWTHSTEGTAVYSIGLPGHNTCNTKEPS